MILSNAGQPYPVKISEGKVREVKVGGYPIGQFSEPWYSNEFVPLKSSDRILLYSDGLIEAQNRDGECFGRERLFQILSRSSKISLKMMVADIVRELEKFCGDCQYEDDVSLIAIEKSSPKTDISTVIPNTQHVIGEFIEQFKNRIFKKYLPTDKQRDHAEYALVECLDNAWEHGNGRDSGLNITLTWSVSDERITVSIEDQGKGFIPEIPQTMPPLDNPRGRGLFTLHDLTEKLSYNSIGNRVTFSITRRM